MAIRKLLAFVMAVAMVFSMLPMQLLAAETDPAAKISSKEENALVMKYDDRLDVSELGLTGEPTIETKEITSNKVCTDTPDDAVVVYVDGKLIAVGVGTAQVTWGTGDTAISYDITVEPATISLLLVTGHSQAAGAQGNKAESVVCEDGQVYSTNEGPKYNFTLCEGNPADLTVKAKDVTGMGIGYGSATKPLRIDALTEAGDGVRALDGALGYQWHKRSGEKVWVLNAAKGSTSLQTWQEGGYNYRHAVELFKAAAEILYNEYQAGHYNVNKMGVVNYTTANGDEIWPADDYVKAFNSMWHGFQNEFALYDFNEDGVKDTVDCIGLVPVWAPVPVGEWDKPHSEPLAFYNYSNETYTGKILNYYMSAFEDDGVIMASTIARNWLTDADVKAYFEANPVENMYGKLENGTTHTSPTVLRGGINADGVHYTQLGYNVQGIDIANSMYDYWTGNNALQSVKLLQEDGVTEVPESIEVPLNRSYVIVPETVPSTAKLTYKITGDAAYYENGFVRGNHEGNAVLTVMDTEGTPLKTVNITITEKVAKEDYKWYVWDFTTPSLTNTEGSSTDNTLSLYSSAVSDTSLENLLTDGALDLTSNLSTLKMDKSIILDTPKAWSVELVAAGKSDTGIGTFLSTDPAMSKAKYMYINSEGDLMLLIKAEFTADDGTVLGNNYTYFKVSDEDFENSILSSDFDITKEHKYELRCAGGVMSYWLDGEKIGDLALSEQSSSRGDEAKHYTSKQPDYNGENFNSMTMQYWGTGSNAKPYSQGLTAKVKKLAVYGGTEKLNLIVVLGAVQEIEPIAIWPGDEITLPEPQTGDYCAKFLYWCENLNGTGTAYNAGDVYTVSADGSVTLYAIWDNSAGTGGDHVYDNPCDDTVCNECGSTRVPPHVYDNGCDTDCNVCGEVRATEHVYDNGCDTDCNECGEVRATEHVYNNGCDADCNECGAERDVPGHVYDNAFDTNCNACNEERTLPYNAYGTTGDCIWYLEGTKLTISGNGAMEKYTTSAKAPWGTAITEVIIEEGVTGIGNRAFFSAARLAAITIPHSVTTIGAHAFNKCSGLSSVTILGSVTSIGDAAFANCTSLTSIAIPASVTTIGTVVFTNCTSFESVWYEGSESDRENINIAATNDNLNAATWHYVDNACDTTCNKDGCDAVRTITHDYSVQDKNETEHWMKCSVCGVIDETSRKSHIHDNTCDTDCNVCGKERTVLHQYDDAEDLICNVCGHERPPYTPGDMNNDSFVNSDDAIYLLYHTLLGEVRYPVNQPCDFNKDGKVNSDDAIYLLYHTLLGAERYPI